MKKNSKKAAKTLEAKTKEPSKSDYQQLVGIMRQNNILQFKNWLTKYRGHIDLDYPVEFSNQPYRLFQLFELPEFKLMPIFVQFQARYPNLIKVREEDNFLQFSAEKGKLGLLTFYFKVHPELLRKTNTHNSNLLHFAASNPDNTEEIVDFLITEVKLDPKAKTQPDGLTAAFIAAMHGARGVLKALHKHQVDIDPTDSKGYYARYNVEAQNNQSVIDYIQQHSPKKIPAEIAFHAAIEYTDLKKVRELRSEIKDLNQFITLTEGAQAESALYRATAKKKLPIVRYLLEEKADVNLGNSTDITPLMWAARSGDEECAGILIEHKANVNAQNQVGATALLQGVTKGHHKIVSLLLTARANVHHKTVGNQSYLHIAAHNNDPKTLEQLIKTDIDVNARTKDGFTALQCGVTENKMLSVIKLKSDPRVDADICRLGCAPVTHETIYANNQPMLKVLLELKVSSNQTDSNGLFSISIAVILNNLPMIELLQKYHAERYARLSDFYINFSTLLAVAVNFKVDLDIINFLLKNYKWNTAEKSLAAITALASHQKKYISKLLPEIKDINKKDEQQLLQELEQQFAQDQDGSSAVASVKASPATDPTDAKEDVVTETKKEPPLTGRSFLAKEKGYRSEELKVIMNQQKEEAKKFKDLTFKPGIRLWADVKPFLVVSCSWFNGLLNQDSKELHGIEKINIPNSFLYIDPKLTESKDPRTQALLDKQRWCFNNENGLKSLAGSYSSQYRINNGPVQEVEISHEITTSHKSVGHARLLVFKVKAEQGQGALFMTTLELFAPKGLGEKVFHLPALIDITLTPPIMSPSPQQS